ncbi:hypothetical protein K1T73_12005 [Roseovarius sp. SCSIO 43702]|uniref:hypothetical protein n=1 Tax=Roseovarius sp. SCSIO 43702 TaxID=2823043 RepID=UPI001C72BD78|nr:hypothetical protein [Roseovarius sp. SCSIO 43702]QYX55801.1 hypothetical protein K1T73_12005 [Roseovarius sp. SCSIO 43702]
MSKPAAFLLIGLFFGAGGGYLAGHALAPEAPDPPATVHDHSAHDHGDGAHDTAHDRMVEAGNPAPTLRLALTPDGPQSRNLHIIARNFTFDPEGVNGPHEPGHGHAHVYVNGVKVMRAYGPHVHLSALPRGDHEIRVTLTTNDHAQLVRDGTPIAATLPLVIE